MAITWRGFISGFYSCFGMRIQASSAIQPAPRFCCRLQYAARLYASVRYFIKSSFPSPVLSGSGYEG